MAVKAKRRPSGKSRIVAKARARVTFREVPAGRGGLAASLLRANGLRPADPITVTAAPRGKKPARRKR